MAAATPAPSQWQRLNGLLQSWLEERQQLRTLLYLLSDADTDRDEQHTLLQPFCQLLMDYISAGYFEIYTPLLEQADLRHPPGSAAARRILAELDDSTDLALAFNEAMEGNPAATQMDFPARMAQLALALERRFALEDQLVFS